MPSSLSTRGSSSLETFTNYARPKINIELVNQADGLVNSYTSKDRIEGTAMVTVDRDTRFDEVDITFEGTARTSVERSALPGRTGAYQTFLRLRQPIDDTLYPTPRVFEPGRTYQFPFTFVVPDRLLPHACSHHKTNQHVGRSHTMVPPSLGDPMLASDGKSLLDDLSPEMCRVSYVIRVVVNRRSNSSRNDTKTLVSAGKKVRVVPVIDEEPPLNFTDQDSVYCTRREKDVKRGLMRSKLGRLVVTASQPKPVRLSPPNGADSDIVSTAATVHLRFDPVGSELPPRLGTVWSRLRASTFYSAEPWADYPSASSALLWTQVGRGIYSETAPLSKLCVASAQWTKHSAVTFDRCDSLQSTSSEDSLAASSTSPARQTYYTASVVIPITLPTSKAFVPTFHSCLISRTYTLELSISYHTPCANLVSPSASLRVPIQLVSQPRLGGKGSELDISQAEVNAEFFSPRRAPVTDSSPCPPPPEYTALQGPILRPDQGVGLLSAGQA
ncbi:arrestin (or S-antigen), N-terminal domain protein [Aspergillus candidus]|uniref:Uncharacterized protein n=1 Tax=Aspergillus candidus TaxID=41067 RepID=A0A2I2FKA1_ASPCN|nr:hypothetical protein BDW47DRAFT_74707 [Aspergillus candidus]PLB41034.1 hypothetical protein BDW47DRAFT_74707 [Aspergillus candidus]